MRFFWSEKIFGYSWAVITGKRTEQFINACVRSSVNIREVKRISPDSVRVLVKVSDLHKLKAVLKKTDCRVHFEGRGGLPFFLNKRWQRTGLTAGLIGFLIVIFMLSNMIWKVDINGASPKLEDRLNQLLKKHHIKPGSLIFTLPNMNTIENELAGSLDEVTWLGITKDGTTISVEVVQKELPSSEKKTGPRDLVANKKAVVKRIYTEQGTGKVNSGEFVRPGQVLIAGVIGEDKDPRFVAAKGQVIGETWYKASVTVPLNTSFDVQTGKKYHHHFLTWKRFKIPVWGFKSHPFKQSDTQVESSSFRFLLWDLPLGYKKVTLKETRMEERTWNEAKARKEAVKSARESLLRQLQPPAKIISTKVGHQSVTDGKLTLELTFIAEENLVRSDAYIPKERLEEIKQKNNKEKAQNE